jgi:spore germination protein
MGYRDWFAKYQNLLLGLLVALLVGIGYLWYSSIDNRAIAQDNALEANYQASFFDLVSNVENLDVLLGKAKVSNADGQKIITLTTAWHEAETAKANLGNLPLEMPSMMRSQHYMAQLGDFCYSLAQKLANKAAISQNEKDTLEQIHEQVRTMHVELREILNSARQGDFRFSDLLRSDVNLTPEAQDIVDGLGRMDERLQDEVPTLTYDGPFSDHVINRSPRGLTGDEISSQEAANIALEFVSEMGNDNNYNVERTEANEGRNIETYNVQLTLEGQDNSNATVGISQKGGHVIWAILDGNVSGDNTVNRQDALKTAQEFIENRDMGEFIAIGHLEEGNELQVNYALVENDVIIYPDMLQVTVSLTNGEVIGYDAVKYYTSHTKRELSKPKISKEEAKKEVNGDLKIDEIRLALIPLSNLDEVLCYEIIGEMEGDKYHIYVNTETGEEEKILLIVETNEGTKSI